MTKYISIIIVAFISSCNYKAVNNPPHTVGFNNTAACRCPENNFVGIAADTVFRLSNGKLIALCGYRNEGTDPVSWSEFVLAECGSDSIVDYWDATITAEVKVKGDTLLVEHIWNLPTGKSYEYRNTIYGTDQVYKNGSKTIVAFRLNRHFPKYNEAQIQTVLKEYERIDNALNDNIMVLANKLFIASISGSEKAKEYFDDFDDKFEIDGAYMEEYRELKSVLRFYADE